jgi:recombination associated protein RdgC
MEGNLNDRAGTSATSVIEAKRLRRKTLSSLLIKPLGADTSLIDAIANGLLDPARMPAELELGTDCELERDGIIRCRDLELTGHEIRAHLDAGKRVRKLALTWKERLAFVLSDDLRFRRLKFLDLVQEGLDRQNLDSPETVRDAEFAIATAEIRGLLNMILATLA